MPDEILAIADWSNTFETSDSRKYKTLFWVALPIDYQSSGYQALIECHPVDAPAMYGAWCALLGIAARCPTRGVLANSKGKPLTAARVARLTHLPVEPFEKLFEWAKSEEIGWLKAVEETATGYQPVGNPVATDQEQVATPATERNEHNGTNTTQNDGVCVEVPFDDVVQEWNRTTGQRCQMTSKRKTSLKTRWKDPWWRENWRAAIKSAASSDFHMGSGSKGWTADLEWFLKPDSATKLIELASKPRRRPEATSSIPDAKMDNAPIKQRNAQIAATKNAAEAKRA